MDPARLHRIVKTVTRRALSRGCAVSAGERAGGVHVDVGLQQGSSAALQARNAEQAVRPGQAAMLITAQDLAQVPDGGQFTLAQGARLTALAEEEAWARHIDLRRGTDLQGGKRLRVALGADHGGYEIKEAIKGWLRELGHSFLDFGTHDTSAVDYPDFARAVAEAVASGQADLGVCVDGAGIGSAIAANKVPGARAAMCYDQKTAKNAREHNFANVLSLGGPVLGAQTCRQVLTAFLATPEGAARHARRVDKIRAIEARYSEQDHPLRRVLPEVGGT